MRGWKVRKIPTNRAYEGRLTGTADRGIVRARFRLGQRFHSLGYGLGDEFCRCLFRIKDRPAVLGSMAEFAGCLSAALDGKPVLLPPETVRFWKNERRRKMARKITSFFPCLAKFAKEPQPSRKVPNGAGAGAPVITPVEFESKITK
jgi:hypothetical protein